METNSSGEDVVIKIRKPYTITKQRERWTEEEHNRFLEALRLYGRAWQKIEEHVATKTAVQIRSHAQKFFSKVEKEAEAKGVSKVQTLDIAIPPPRPKRKPCNPYPRKMTGSGTIPLLKSGVNDGNKSLGSLPEMVNDDQQQSKPNENMHTDNFSGYSSSVNRSCIETSNTNTFREFLPLREEGKESNSCGDVNARYLEKNAVNNEQGPQIYPSHIPEVMSLGSSITSPHGDYQNHIMSTLLQTPALYNAATLASSFWPPPQPGQGNIPPNLAAMAAATVAAATAWWTANGMFPICAPLTYHHQTISGPSGEVSNRERTVHQKHHPEAVPPKHQTSLESEEIVNGSKPDSQVQPSAPGETGKQVDRSSCGSNTPSSGDDVEAGLSDRQENNNDTNVEVKEVSVDTTNNPNGSDSNARRSNRISSSNNVTDPWKSVSDEGRIAFRALFSREVLPQSFSYRKEEDERYPMALDLNSVAQLTPLDDEEEKRDNVGFLGIGFDVSKLSRGRTCFKPYKRCSMEVKEQKDHVEQKDSKRIRLETKVPT